MMMRFTLLKARDPSLIHCCMTNVKTVDDSSSESDDEDHLQVYLRIKAGVDNYEDLYGILDSQTIVTKFPNDWKIQDDAVKQKYSFSKVFKPETTQVQIFNEIVKPKLLKFLNGGNSNLLTYGVSSSGKTYTVVGTAAEPGIIPRALEYLFRTLSDLKNPPTIKPLPFGSVCKLTEKELEIEKQLKDKILNFNWSNSARDEHINTYCAMQSRLSEDAVAQVENDPNVVVSVWVSLVEIYNESIYDLLHLGKSKGDKLKLGSFNSRPYVKNLKLVHVASGIEAYQVLQYGLNNLNYAKTMINDHSSRSHFIFTVWLIQGGSHRPDDCYVSHFNFCDLAGAERVKKTQNIGVRLKESNNINTSLSVLGRCIAAVRKAQKTGKQHVIPFRESKLTQLFQQALSGDEEICMIVNINPCRELYDETQHVLNFSAVAKDIMITERPIIMPVRSERITQLLRPSISKPQSEIEKQIENCKNRLAEAVCLLEQEEMTQAREIENIRNSMYADYIRNFEMYQEELEDVLLYLRNKLKEENKIQLQEAKLEILKELGVDPADISDDDSDSEMPSGETVYIDSSDEDSDNTCEIETIVLSSDEEGVESELDNLKKNIGQQRILIAELHEKKVGLHREIEMLKTTYDKDLKQIIAEQDRKIMELRKKYT